MKLGFFMPEHGTSGWVYVIFIFTKIMMIRFCFVDLIDFIYKMGFSINE